MTSRAWSTITYESLVWHDTDDVPGSRRERQQRRQPYRAAIPATIAAADVALPSEVVSLSEDASAEIARFDAESGSDLVPFASLLLRSESAASSRIENLTASASNIIQAELGHGSRNAMIIVANQRAMSTAVAVASQISLASIQSMHSALLGIEQPAIAGRFREEQVWIGGGNFSPHAAVFVPPHHSRVAAAMADLVRFVERTDIPTLAHAALTHAQFETIHPFADGNGRVGRALVHAQLRAARLTRNITVPVSAGLLTDVDSYFRGLDDFRAGDASVIVTQFANAAYAAISNGKTLVADLRAIRADWSERLSVRRDAAARRALDVVMRQPVINAKVLSEELGVGPTNLYRSLEPLVSAGILEEITNSRRNRAWRAREVLAALDAFAARAGRRRRAGERPGRDSNPRPGG